MPMATVSSKTMSLFLKNTAVKSGEDDSNIIMATFSYNILLPQ